MSHITNRLASSAQLERCHARVARVPLPTELLDAVFFAVQCLTQAAGLLLELPQSATARANVVLARWWLVEPGWGVLEDPKSRAGSGKEDGSVDYAHVSAAALYMVAKTGASPRSARDVANVYAYLVTTENFWGGEQRAIESTATAATAYLSDTAYAAFHARVVALEARLLCALGFDAHAALPHPLVVTYLQAMDFLGTGAPTGNALAARALAYCNTALLSPQLLYLTHQPHELAVAAIYSAARDGGCHMPTDLPWWEVFDVDRETLGFLAVALRSVATWADDFRRRLTGTVPGLLTGGILTRQRVAETAATWED